jgi:RimJ/RimL family protein N-acetyltransferase
MNIEKVSPAEWYEMAGAAHLVMFAEDRPPDVDRIQFALIQGDGRNPHSYLTARELESDSCYIQFGGVFPKFRGQQHGNDYMKRYMDWFWEHGYVRINCLVENTNLPMIKVLLSTGFLVIGCRFFEGIVLLEFLMKRPAHD